MTMTWWMWILGGVSYVVIPTIIGCGLAYRKGSNPHSKYCDCLWCFVTDSDSPGPYLVFALWPLAAPVIVFGFIIYRFPIKPIRAVFAIFYRGGRYSNMPPENEYKRPVDITDKETI